MHRLATLAVFVSLATSVAACGSSGTQTTAGAEGSPAATSTVGAPGGSGSSKVVGSSTSTTPAVASQGKITGIVAHLRLALAHAATAIGVLSGTHGSTATARARLGQAQHEAHAVDVEARNLPPSNPGRTIIARVASRAAGTAATIQHAQLNGSARKAISEVRLTLISLMADVSQLGVQGNAQQPIARELSNLNRWLSAVQGA
jgi:hypothetical protein